MRAAPDPSAQLVQLGEPKSLGIFHQHGVRQRDVESILYNCSANQDIELMPHEVEHGLFQFRLAHLAVAYPDASIGCQLLEHMGPFPNGVDPIV